MVQYYLYFDLLTGGKYSSVGPLVSVDGECKTQLLGPRRIITGQGNVEPGEGFDVQFKPTTKGNGV